MGDAGGLRPLAAPSAPIHHFRDLPRWLHYPQVKDLLSQQQHSTSQHASLPLYVSCYLPESRRQYWKRLHTRHKGIYNALHTFCRHHNATHSDRGKSCKRHSGVCQSRYTKCFDNTRSDTSCRPRVLLQRERIGKAIAYASSGRQTSLSQADQARRSCTLHTRSGADFAHFLGRRQLQT